MARFSTSGKVDEHDVRELRMWIDNDSLLYKRKMAMFKNLAQKKKRGVYDRKRAPQLFRYLISDALKQYIREINPDRKEWPFSPASQEQAAKEMVAEFENEYQHFPQTFFGNEQPPPDQGAMRLYKAKKQSSVSGKKKRKRSVGGASGEGTGSGMAKKKAKKKASVGAKKKASVGGSSRRRSATARGRFEIQVRERKEPVIATGKGKRIYDAYVMRDGSRIELPAIIAENQAQARAIARARIRKEIG